MINDYFEWEKIKSIPISALQHYIYCPRQFALIHIEEIYEENIYTIDGNIVHDRVDNQKIYNKSVENSLPIWSDELGIYGVADIVEFKNDIPKPIEYKRGKMKNQLADKIQLMAQAYCLEEMFSVEIETGEIYYNKSRRRKEIIFTSDLKEKLIKTVDNVRNLLIKREVPKPVNNKRCKNCSLKESCMPDIERSINSYTEKLTSKGEN